MTSLLDLRKGYGDFHDYKLIKFPDNSIKFELKTNFVDFVNIILKNNDDLITLMLVKDVLNRKNLNPTLFITYMMYQQDDRLFEKNESFGLKAVCNFINTQKWKEINIFHPHSDKVEFLDNLNIVSNRNFVANSIYEITEGNPSNNLVWVIPDAGAFKTQYKQIEKIDYPDFVICLKSRDHVTGNLVTIVNTDDLKGKDCFIVDDICLGGRTFINIAQQLKDKNAGNIYLVVSHGIFNYGLDQLKPYFKGIYTTDSICTLPQDDFLKIYKL